MRRKNSIKSIFTSERGFTLIEVVVFVIILGFLAGVLIPFTVSLRGSSNPVFVQRAVALAQAELEQTVAQKRASGFAAVATGGCAMPMPPGFNPCTRTVCYVPSTNLNDTSACGAGTNYKRVEVTVNHPAIGNVTAVTLLTSY